MRTNQIRSRPTLRSIAWRVGRFLYCWARREVDRDPRSNGEYWLIDRVAGAAGADPVVLIDIGANRGEWSAAAVRALNRYGRRGEIHAFEPADATFQHLAARFRTEPAVVTHQAAISDRAGEAALYVVAPSAGTNSLLPIAGAHTERARVRTFDDIVDEHAFARVAMVKTDTEGCDLTVLHGARAALRAGLVDVWQFEYNHRWLANRSSLLAVFDFIADLPYRLGRVFGDGIEIYDRWHFELDRFIESNYVLLRDGSVVAALAKTAHFDPTNALR